MAFSSSWRLVLVSHTENCHYVQEELLQDMIMQEQMRDSPLHVELSLFNSKQSFFLCLGGITRFFIYTFQSPGVTFFPAVVNLSSLSYAWLRVLESFISSLDRQEAFFLQTPRMLGISSAMILFHFLFRVDLKNKQNYHYHHYHYH